MVNQTVEYVGDQNKLAAMIERINSVSVLALDIETINWWDREAERVALVQLGFREGGGTASPIRVAIIDTLVGLDLSALRQPLELGMAMKVIHNASYDAVRLARHYGINTSPIFDTMLAARRSGQKKCSLKAQVETHLGVQLDKAEQRSDWGQRPLSQEQMNYAALDASCTLMLYELQIERGLRGDYELPQRNEKPNVKPGAIQTAFQLSDEAPRIKAAVSIQVPQVVLDDSTELNPAALALLGIVTELSGRYSPEQLAVSVGSERIGLAGWIIDIGKSRMTAEMKNSRQIVSWDWQFRKGLLQSGQKHRQPVPVT
ncbi:MAG: ribonuclease D [Acidobacteriota bacterium]